MADSEIAAWVARAKAGDAAAFEQLVRRTARIVYAQIVAAVHNREKAEDLSQEAFLVAWKSIQSVNDPAGFVPWLLTLARNVTLDRAKFDSRRKRAAVHIVGEETAATGPAPPEELERMEAREQALKLLEELPIDYRQPLMLRYLAGADYSTIREQLQLSDGALRGLLNRGMALLRERMAQSGADDER